MTTMNLTMASAGTTQSAAAGLLGWLRRAAVARENRVAAEALASMDDYLLRDIGVSRSQAYKLARYGRD